MRAFLRFGRWRLAPWAVALGALVSCSRHDGGDASGAPAPSASAAVGLSSGDAARVLAKVGSRTITLGDYAASLDRMDRFERLRYQTPDRRKQLLEELIDVELLAQEAERRGLGERPETQELVRQILRDEVLRELRSTLPRVEDVPATEVRAFYDAHRAEFREPERRRISVIGVSTRAEAERALAAARGTSAAAWGEAVRKFAPPGPPADGIGAPAELLGDLGLVTGPGAGATDNPRVPEAVRTAAFEIGEVGGVLDRIVPDSGRHYVVRLTGKSAPRDRSFEEAERAIRVRLVEEKLERAVVELEKELRARFPVRIHEEALRTVPVPSAGRP